MGPKKPLPFKKVVGPGSKGPIDVNPQRRVDAPVRQWVVGERVFLWYSPRVGAPLGFALEGFVMDVLPGVGVGGSLVVRLVCRGQRVLTRPMRTAYVSMAELSRVTGARPDLLAGLNWRGYARYLEQFERNQLIREAVDMEDAIRDVRDDVDSDEDPAEFHEPVEDPLNHWHDDDEDAVPDNVVPADIPTPAPLAINVRGPGPRVGREVAYEHDMLRRLNVLATNSAENLLLQFMQEFVNDMNAERSADGGPLPLTTTQLLRGVQGKIVEALAPDQRKSTIRRGDRLCGKFQSVGHARACNSKLGEVNPREMQPRKHGERGRLTEKQSKTCHFCNREYSDQGNFLKHIKNSHLIKYSKFTCPFCTVTRSSRWAIRAHIGQKHADRMTRDEIKTYNAGGTTCDMFELYGGAANAEDDNSGSSGDEEDERQFDPKIPTRKRPRRNGDGGGDGPTGGGCGAPVAV